MRPLRRGLLAVALVVGALIASRGLLFAHATLESSDPKAGSVLTTSPGRIRLVFSEAIDATVSGIRIVPPSGAPTDLAVSADPRNRSALIATLAPLSPGPYRVLWRNMSADGHAMNGAFGFTIRGDTAAALAIVPPLVPPILQADTLSSFGPTRVPLIAALLRGLALGCLMALAGILFFSRRAGVSSPPASRASMLFATAAVVLLAAHLLAWMASAADHGLGLSWERSMLGTEPGHLEFARLAAAAFALGALAGRRMLLALLFSALALVVSGGIGHPAAMHSLWTIPAKAVHLCAGATWLGGLLWLTLIDRADVANFAREARRVSSVALVTVLLVVFSGVIQTRFFIATPSDLIRTTYGVIVLLKIAGVLVLIAFGAHHRYRHLPTLADADAGERLRDSVRYEIGVFALVTLLGGVLAYTPPRGTEAPAWNASAASTRAP